MFFVVFCVRTIISLISNGISVLILDKCLQSKMFESLL